MSLMITKWGDVACGAQKKGSFVGQKRGEQKQQTSTAHHAGQQAATPAKKMEGVCALRPPSSLFLGRYNNHYCNGWVLQPGGCL